MQTAYETFPVALTRPLRWRDGADGNVDLHDPARDAWARLAPWTRAVLVGLEAGEPLPALRARVDAEAVPARERLLRRLLMSLAKVGYLEIQVPVPSTITGRFEVRRELGRGGVGIAYLCRDGEEDRDVVVKRAWGFVHELPLATAALQREAQVLADLDHDSIVRLVSAFDADGRAHLARSLAPGRSLTAAFDGSPGGRAGALRVARGLGGALAHLHARSWLLLDHKPGNVYDDGAHARLVDVGNAELAPDGRATLRSARGTAGFTPPEMREERRADRRSDVWGLGRMIAFVLTGRMFRRDPRLAAVLEGIVEAEPRALVERLCADDPEARPASVADALALAEPALR